MNGNSKRPWGNTGEMRDKLNYAENIIPQDFYVGLKNWITSTAGIDWEVAIDGAHRL